MLLRRCAISCSAQTGPATRQTTGAKPRNYSHCVRAFVPLLLRQADDFPRRSLCRPVLLGLHTILVSIRRFLRTTRGGVGSAVHRWLAVAAQTRPQREKLPEPGRQLRNTAPTIDESIVHRRKICRSSGLRMQDARRNLCAEKGQHLGLAQARCTAILIARVCLWSPF